jgi:hypothetical protein
VWFFLSLQLLLLKVCLLSGVQDRPNSKSRPSYVSRERLYGISVDAHMNCRCSTNALVCLDSQRHLLVGTIMGVLSWQEVTRQMPQSCTFCKCCLVHSVDGHNMDVKSITAGWYWWQVWCCNFWIRVHSSVAIVRSGSVLWYLVFTDLISTLLYPPSNSCWASICITPKYLPTPRWQQFVLAYLLSHQAKWTFKLICQRRFVCTWGF